MSLFATLLNLLIPPHCPGCKKKHVVLCETCEAHIRTLLPRHTDDVIAPFPYQDPIVKKCIRALKFGRARDIRTKLGEMLHESTLEILSDIRELSPTEKIIVIPIPLSDIRRRQRGFNQAEDIARAFVSNDPSYILETNILKKIKDTKPQSSLHSRKERLTNIRGVFAITHTESIYRKVVIVVDDIATTGATLLEARRLLRSAGARKVILIALAH